MHRTQIYLSDDEVEALDRHSASSGRSKSQLIREAIDRAYVRGTGTDLLEALNASVGAWRGRRETGAQFVDRMRRGRLGRLHKK